VRPGHDADPLRHRVGQPVPGQAAGSIALPPNHADQVGKIIFRVTDLEGQKTRRIPATNEIFEKTGNFARATANWPIDVAPPGGHHVTAIVLRPNRDKN